jgi:hypothetical protein
VEDCEGRVDPHLVAVLDLLEIDRVLHHFVVVGSMVFLFVHRRKKRASEVVITESLYNLLLIKNILSDGGLSWPQHYLFFLERRGRGRVFLLSRSCFSWGQLLFWVFLFCGDHTLVTSLMLSYLQLR